eukprot:715912-Prorocentrum_minimum.AAC.1
MRTRYIRARLCFRSSWRTTDYSQSLRSIPPLLSLQSTSPVASPSRRCTEAFIVERHLHPTPKPAGPNFVSARPAPGGSGAPSLAPPPAAAWSSAPADPTRSAPAGSEGHPPDGIGSCTCSPKSHIHTSTHPHIQHRSKGSTTVQKLFTCSESVHKLFNRSESVQSSTSSGWWQGENVSEVLLAGEGLRLCEPLCQKHVLADELAVGGGH